MQRTLGALLVIIPLHLLSLIPSRSTSPMPRSSLTPFGSNVRPSHCIRGYDNKSTLVISMVGNISLGHQISITQTQWKQTNCPLLYHQGSCRFLFCPFASGQCNHEQPLKHLVLVKSLPMPQLFQWPCNNYVGRRPSAHRCWPGSTAPLTDIICTQKNG